MSRVNRYRYYTSDNKPLYTLEEAKLILEEKAREKKFEILIDKVKSVNAYFLKQKLCGLILAAIGIIVPFVASEDATVSLVIVPVGIYLMFTKKKWMVI